MDAQLMSIQGAVMNCPTGRIGDSGGGWGAIGGGCRKNATVQNATRTNATGHNATSFFSLMKFGEFHFNSLLLKHVDETFRPFANKL
jgi:hypothetical protein